MPTETTRPAWQSRHLERQAREREARRAAHEYSLAQLEAASETKQCAKCRQRLPLEDFRLLKSGVKAGQRKSRCKPCLAEDDRASYAAKQALRPPRPPRLPKVPRPPKRPRLSAGARATRTVLRQEQRTLRAAAREEKRRQAIARAAELADILRGANPSRCAATEEEWELAAAELRTLWLRSGDKQCVTCKATVPPTAILPPGPGNFYTGSCQSCAGDLYQQNRAAVGCKHPEGSRLLTLRDGSRITVAVLAQRYAERLRSRRVLLPKNRTIYCQLTTHCEHPSRSSEFAYEHPGRGSAPIQPHRPGTWAFEVPLRSL